MSGTGARASEDLAAAARNLLFECGGLAHGDELLLVQEDPSSGWYDADLFTAVTREACNLGITTSALRVGTPTNLKDEEISRVIDASDNVLFMARIGDQDRFSKVSSGKKRVMSYVRSVSMLASAYGRTSHHAMVALKEATNAALLGADHIEITCPKGSAVTGTVSANQEQDADVGVIRFPMGVPIPVLADTFSGQVILADYLTSSGSRVYDPAWVALGDHVAVTLENGRIARLDASEESKRRVTDHYERISRLFGIDRDAVHSWHAGIHPGVTYDRDIEENPDRWSNTVFTSPRFLHFHTCGAYAPGEICWMIAEPTVKVDKVALWEAGEFKPWRHHATRAVLERHNQLRALFPLR